MRNGTADVSQPEQLRLFPAPFGWQRDNARERNTRRRRRLKFRLGRDVRASAAKALDKYLSNGLISVNIEHHGERGVTEPRASGAMSKALNAAWVRPFLFLIFIVIAWDLSIRLFKIPAYQIPAPADVVAVLWQDWPELARQSWPTTYATIWGFVLSALFGIPAAMLIAGSRTVESYVYPLLVFSQSVPKIAIAPLFVVWFGFGILPKIISAFLLGFFPVVVSAVQGFKSVDPDMVDLARAMQGSRFHVFRAVNLPHALPAIFSGLKVSITLAVVGAVVGEFVGSNSGIGYVLQRSIGTFDLPTMFAALVILALLGVVLFWIVDRIERLVVPWHVSQRDDIIVAA
jgi:NitT/TauT family transport system permease protein